MATINDGIVPINLMCCSDKQHEHENKELLDAINQALIDRVNSDRVISVTNDNVAHTITFGFKDSADVVVDLSSLSKDIHISDMELSGETLVLKDSDGNDITLDLSKFLTVDDIVRGNVIKPTIAGDKVSLDLDFVSNVETTGSMLEIIGESLVVRTTFRDEFGNFPTAGQILTTVPRGGTVATQWTTPEQKLYINGGKYAWRDDVFFDNDLIPFDTYMERMCNTIDGNSIVIDKDCTIKINFSTMCSTLDSQGEQGQDILTYAYHNDTKLPLPSWVGEDKGLVSSWRREAGNAPTMTIDVKKGDKIGFKPDFNGTLSGVVSGVFSFIIEEV